ncbi:polyribonucleotide nucleotidyltransferase [Candidatus Gottesmanbacteria bacterium RIFCSPHIGHO2_01_FULL_46_14]|uniref:Polyribonucleotide nucleotidyltransferase n=3 Tax=Candidatus Gottesmaniibacteriota TaxID=1752720 RepID=A0A1F5ZS74_9BACT|nr:MAG: Polyribonucleotide nucleotidyltransferase [Candidatus Gottesmanbacteria bacterium GW2011_GWA1_47_8]OGG14957.1 MAG: polyribonucleotide nucleotidyltransferase [Candidatus Gottesmanbacteria bacterium RIFCSPHIGHO2_01_FULL_46_14]OGG28775.1 MAG: polyribonucleotide nucleotidyltransferase [Candidatus Gottesmanbacteria bacterium RIFCSPLOWO2_01_FULL_46_21]
MKITKKTVDIGGRTLSLEVGRFAEQASASVLASYGDTMVLATVTASSKETTLDYFPLSVEYVERLYAGGRIKGSRWVKREGRPSDDAVLAGRVIDRSIRPLFPKTYKHDVQVIITVLSVDGVNDPDILGLVATSAAIALSPIPWNGPIAGVRVGYVKDNGNSSFLINPTITEQGLSDFDFVVSGTREKTVMLEGGFCETPENVVFEAIGKAKEANAKIIDCITSLVKAVGSTKVPVSLVSQADELKIKISQDYKKEMAEAFAKKAQKEFGGAEVAELAKIIAEAYGKDYTVKVIEEALDGLFKKQVRDNVLEKGQRFDGRKIDEVRPVSVDVGILPRTHGSAVFQRGQTQVLTVATLGTPSLEQLIESPAGEESKRYIHHYSMPPYSVGETGRVGTPSRREIGHGALAERALLSVIPSEEEFPYTIRLVSEVMSSNGSTSMASTCGSTLALMDAGVPIKEPVSGISIGLMTDKKKFVLLTDIMGIEDFAGDMDFKVAGTKNGITAIQLDIKIDGLTDEIVEGTLERAKVARLKILADMLAVLDAPRKALSQYAPKVQIVKVPTEKIGEVIGPGGRMIRQIIATTGATVDVNDDGSIVMSGSAEAVDKAVTWVQGLTRDVQVNEEFEGEVKRILPFGAFVEVLPGKEGMVHVSQMSTGFVNDPNDVVKLGQKVKVRVMEIDDQHRVNLSMLFGDDAKKVAPRQRQDGGDRPRRSFDRKRRY